MPDLFGPAWIAAFKREIDASVDYKFSSNKWESPVVLVTRADPRRGRPHAQAIFLDLWHGTCRAARVGTQLDIERAPFVISAEREVWLELLSGKIELLSAVMLRKIHIEKGNPTALIGSVAAIRALVKCAVAASKGFD